MKLEYFQQIFEKYSNIKFHDNPSSGSRVVPRGGTNGRTDMAKPVATFRSFSKAPKNVQRFIVCILLIAYEGR
jgi:hypothetical protein